MCLVPAIQRLNVSRPTVRVVAGVTVLGVCLAFLILQVVRF